MTHACIRDEDCGVFRVVCDDGECRSGCRGYWDCDYGFDCDKKALICVPVKKDKKYWEKLESVENLSPDFV